MAVTQFGRRILGVKYQQGVNEAEVMSLFADHQVTDACTVTLGPVSGGILPVYHTLPAGGGTVLYTAVMSGDWIVMDNSLNLVGSGYTDAIVAAMFRTMGQSATSIASTTEFSDAVKAAVAASAGAFGVGVLSSLAVGTTNVPVTVKPTLPNTSYTATAFVSGSSLLSNVSTGTPVKTSTSVVTVPVTNSGLVTLNNISVLVHCTY